MHSATDAVAAFLRTRSGADRWGTYQRSPWINSDLAERAAKEWASTQGISGGQGGWIYRPDGSTVCQGWFNVWTKYRRQIEDYYTSLLTASGTFDALTHPESKTYRPTLLVLKGAKDWRYAYLANAYDVAMARQGDRRRAYIGSGS